jgi:hypothetical protein
MAGGTSQGDEIKDLEMGRLFSIMQVQPKCNNKGLIYKKEIFNP